MNSDSVKYRTAKYVKRVTYYFNLSVDQKFF